MKKFSIGLCSVSFRKSSPTEILEEMKKVGLDHIEWGSDIHAPADDEKSLLNLIKLQREYGVTSSSYGTYFKVGVHPAEELLPYIRAAKLLGTSVLRIWAGEKNSEDFTKEETECHNKTYTNCFQSTLELTHAVNSPHFQTYWQPNQFCDEAYNLAAAAALSPYTKNVHVFHWNEKEKFPLARGKEIWKKYLNCFSGNETLLLEFMPDKKIESLQNEANTLRSILEELQ